MVDRTNIVVAFSLLVLLTPMATIAADSSGASSGTAATLADIMMNLQSNIPWLRRLVVGFCYVFGLGLILKAVFMLKAFGQQKTMMASHSSVTKPMITLFIGAGLFYLPTVIDTSVASLFAYGSSSVLDYPVASDWSNLINPLIDIVKLLGLITFVRGWIMLAKYGSEGGGQQGVGGKALMHMIGGVFAMNIVATIDIVKASLGV